MPKQVVYLSTTISGTPGLFTRGMLALMLTPDEYRMCKESRQYFENFCAKYKFQAEKELT